MTIMIKKPCVLAVTAFLRHWDKQFTMVSSDYRISTNNEFNGSRPMSSNLGGAQNSEASLSQFCKCGG